MDQLDILYSELTLTRCEEETRGIIWWGNYTQLLTDRINPSSWWGWSGATRKCQGKTDTVFRNSEGQIHRLGAPAYINRCANIVEWWKNNKLHREGGPAVIYRAYMAWVVEGKLHNLDGPAVVDPAGPCLYYIDGVKYSPKEYQKEITRRAKKK